MTARPSPAASIAGTVRGAGRVAVALTVACGVIALAVHVWFAAAARRWLAFPFAGIPARPGEAANIFIHNLRGLAAIGGLLMIAQSAYWTGGARATRAAAPDDPAARRGAARGGSRGERDRVGGSVGAYGTRMLRAALPHGPVELAAYSLALSLYLQARSRPVPARRLLAAMALSAVDARDRRRAGDLRERMRSARTLVLHPARRRRPRGLGGAAAAGDPRGASVRPSVVRRGERGKADQRSGSPAPRGLAASTLHLRTRGGSLSRQVAVRWRCSNASGSRAPSARCSS